MVIQHQVSYVHNPTQFLIKTGGKGREEREVWGRGGGGRVGGGNGSEEYNAYFPCEVRGESWLAE